MGLDRDHRITFNTSDLLGTTTAVVDLVTGELTECSTYYPGGARETYLTTPDADLQPEPMGFTGKEGDEEVGLVYFGERYLIPRIARWASPDPLAIHALGGGEAMNSYHYVAGNLLQARDPEGLQDDEPWDGDEDFAAGSPSQPTANAGAARLLDETVLQGAPIVPPQGRGGLHVSQQVLSQYQHDNGRSFFADFSRQIADNYGIAVSARATPNGGLQIYAIGSASPQSLADSSNASPSDRTAWRQSGNIWRTRLDSTGAATSISLASEGQMDRIPQLAGGAFVTLAGNQIIASRNLSMGSIVGASTRQNDTFGLVMMLRHEITHEDVSLTERGAVERTNQDRRAIGLPTRELGAVTNQHDIPTVFSWEDQRSYWTRPADVDVR
jgi:RHS repeat-associated protein